MQKISLVQQALSTLPGFAQKYDLFSKQLLIEQYSDASIQSYCSKLSALCLHFGKLPEALTSDDLQKYFSLLVSRSPSPDISYFKHTVCSLRCYCRIFNLVELKVSLPRLRKSKKLPVVLSQCEVRRLLRCCVDVRDKSLLGLIYSCGLRLGEVRKLSISDVDSGRMMVHIRQGKGGKDRYVPLSGSLLVVLRAYYRRYRPKEYLFNGPDPGSPIGENEVYFLFKAAVRAAGIRKHVTLHTLRHSYATHLLEMGMNILQIKELMGHSNIKTTMTYLHLVPDRRSDSFSPLDRLFPPAIKSSQT